MSANKIFGADLTATQRMKFLIWWVKLSVYFAVLQASILGSLLFDPVAVFDDGGKAVNERIGLQISGLRLGVPAIAPELGPPVGGPGEALRTPLPMRQASHHSRP